MTPSRLPRRALGTLALAPAAGRAQAPAHRILALYPSGHFLENLLIRPDGAVLFTSYFAGEVGLWSEARGQAVFARIEGHPVSLAPAAGGVLVALHGVAFTEGARLAGSNAVQVLSAEGRPGQRIPLPQAVFLNGMIRQSEGIYLIADSALGRIWRLDLASGALSTFLETPEMAPSPARPGLPAVNGLKLAGGALYFSNSVRPGIYRLPLAADGSPGGPVRQVVALPGVDDFEVLPDGGFIAATHGDVVLHVSAGGAIRPLLDSADIAGCTAVAVTGRPGGGVLVYVAASGGLLERRGLPAHLVRLDLPGGL